MNKNLSPEEKAMGRELLDELNNLVERYLATALATSSNPLATGIVMTSVIAKFAGQNTRVAAESFEKMLGVPPNVILAAGRVGFESGFHDKKFTVQEIADLRQSLKEN